MKDLIGAIIREFRIQQNMSQKKLAQNSGISVNSISRYENGERIPHLSAISQIARGLSIPVTSFFVHYNLDLTEEALPKFVASQLRLFENRSETEATAILEMLGRIRTYIKSIGYEFVLNVDKIDENLHYQYIEYPDGFLLGVSDEELYELAVKINEYLQFQLEQKKNGRVNTKK